MNILIIGYGKMGKSIEYVAQQRNHVICKKITSSNSRISNITKNEIYNIDTSQIDVAIEFTTPESAYNNIKACLKKNIPIVSGTTGDWLSDKRSLDEICKKNSGSFLHASNFSVSMNIFFELNKNLAHLMKNEKHKIIIEETHHSEKKDSPSGTALVLKKDITNELNNNDIDIISHRIGTEMGTHKVQYISKMDEVEIKHTSKTRKSFAYGAVLAAEWLICKKGVYNMSDVIKGTKLI